MGEPDWKRLHLKKTLAVTFVWEEPDPDHQETLVTVTFEPAAPGTRLILDQGLFKTPARWELHRAGWSETLGRLELALRERA